MRKYVTKYNSTIDRFVLSVLIMEIILHFNLWLNYQFRNLDGFYWLIVLLVFAFGAVTTFFITILYWNLHSEIKQLERLQFRVFKYLYTPNEGLKESKVLKLIEDICNATNVPIKKRKPLFDEVSKFYVDYFPDHTIPGYVSKMWKKAVIEYKKYQIWND